MKTIATIITEIKTAGFMTEEQMNLLRKRSNEAQKDLFDYELDRDGYGIKIDEEWANKGIKWLRSLLKKNGEPKVNSEFGFREAEIIRTAKASEFTFVCFYNGGSDTQRFYIPVYKLAGMRYRVEDGKIIIVG